ncbi:hypothetical protein Srubr_18000 [Streptomyces rubradiris]|uniref:LacI family transcriptional regulator n=1 Tax=Streptomyces rubradiris TaxID=285531 RepID=A0ABQ3R7X8_STRRR|nr:hypothetical protein Srubr_18000 [Streptomyces rubradiris]
MQRYERLRARGVPFVLVDGFSPRVQAPFISPDDRAAMTLAVTHLVSLGHTRIGLALGPKRFVPVQRKIEGFVRAVRDQLGLAAQTVEGELIQHSLYTLEGGQAAAAALIERGLYGGGLRQRHDGAGRDTHGPAAGPGGTPGRVGGRLRRLPADRLHRPAPDHGAQAGPVAMGQAAVRTLLEEIRRDPGGRTAEFVFMPELVVPRLEPPRLRTVHARRRPRDPGSPRPRGRAPSGRARAPRPGRARVPRPTTRVNRAEPRRSSRAPPAPA